MKTFYIFILSILSIQVYSVQDRKVLIVRISGARPDAIQKANTPVLDGLISKGFYTYESWHRGITNMIPSYTTIMTGVEYNKHRVVNSNHSGNNFANFPYFPTRAKSCISNLYCSEIIEWSEMQDSVVNTGWDEKIDVGFKQDFLAAQAAKLQLANPNLDVLTVAFDSVEHCGHDFGFHADSIRYVAAIEKDDAYLGIIINALQSRPTYATEDWIILITTDYGATLTGHGGNSVDERKVWWIGAGNKAVSRQLSNTVDPGSVALNNYDAFSGAKSPAQYDIAVTALDHLLKKSGCGINREWGLDGRSWLDSIHTPELTSVEKNSVKTTDVKVYPNPATDIVSLWFENESNEKVNFRVFNMLGAEIERNELNEIRKNRINIDLSTQERGIYFVELFIGKEKITKKIILN